MCVTRLKMARSKKEHRRRNRTVKPELAIFLAILIAIAGVLLLSQQGSITGAAVSSAGESLGIQDIGIQNIPSITLVLNTTDISKNDTSTNLTAYNTTQTNGSSLKVIYNWLVNGSPIATLNMPFEGINGTSGTTANNKTWDYSGLGNHGNETGGVLWNASGGYDGKGAYMFKTESSRYIDLGDKSHFKNVCNNGCTFGAWVYWTGSASSGAQATSTIIGRLDTTDEDRFFWLLIQNTSLADAQFYIYQNGSTATECRVSGATGILLNGWTHVMARYNGTHAAVFINGTQQVMTNCASYSGIPTFTSINSTAWQDSEKTFIGARDDSSTTQFFNGTIDEVMIFNRSLSNEQIYALRANQTNLITSQETSLGENWTVHATPNNGTGDGTVIISNNLTILNAKPAISTLVLNSTNLARNDTLVNLTAYATTSDVDNDSVKVIYNWLRNGTSIAVINMPFEGINETSTNNAWDYSGFGNNGSENGGVLWNATSGYDSKGAYQFDGVDDTISLGDSSSTRLTCTDGCTFNARIKLKGKATDPTATRQIVTRLDSLNNFMFFGIDFPNNNSYFGMYQNRSSNSLLCSVQSATNSINQDTWIFVTARYNLTHTAVFINGTHQAATACSFSSLNSTSWNNETPYNIGRGSTATTNIFNGTIDELMIFNRSLSLEQVYALWQNQTNVIVAQETNYRENWSVQATPNDGYIDGAIVVSNNLTIKDVTAPQVTFNTPTNGSNFSTSTQIFNATVTDSEAGVGNVLFVFNTNTTPFNVTASNTGDYWNASIPTSTLVEGRHTVLVYANDTVNNINNSVNITITVDFTSPNITRNFVNNPVDNSNFSIRSNNQTFNASVFDALTLVDSVYFWFDNGTGKDFNITGLNQSGNWIVSYNVSALAEEKQGVRIVANDTVNNVNSSFFINFTVDKTPPNVTRNFINNPADNRNFSLSSNNQTFNASVFDALTLVGTVYFWFDNGTGTDVNITGLNQSGNWIVSYNVSALAEEKQGVRIVANDTVNNINSSFFYNFTVDRTPPSVNISTPSAGATLVGSQLFNTSATDNLLEISSVIFQFSNGNSAINRTASNTSGAWNVSLDTTILTEGALTVTVFANDTVGNMNSTQSLSLTVDNVAETSSGGGGGGGGGSTAKIEESEKKEWSSLEAGEVASIEIENKELAVTEIIFTTVEKALNVIVKVTRLNLLPPVVPRFDGYVYKILDISKEATVKEGLFKEATIKFTVEKSWLLDNKIAAEEVAMYHYVDEKWVKLPTQTGKDDNKYVYYSSKTPSFSYFVIGKLITKEIPATKPIEAPVKETPAAAAVEIPEKTELPSWLGKTIQKIAAQIAYFAKGALASFETYTVYWLLVSILILFIIIGTHIKDLPVPEFLWKLKPVPQVKVDQPETIPAHLIPSSAKKEIPQLNHWGKKNYVDLQQELKRVEALIADTPLPEQRNKPLKLTSFKKTSSPEDVPPKTEKVLPQQQLDQEEVEQWIKQMFSSGMAESKIITIVNNSTAIPESRIKVMIDKARVSNLLEKNYHMTQKEIRELKKFISKEKKKGATKRQIVADLIQEGWEAKIISKYVEAYYS